MDLKLVKNLLDLISETELNEVSIEEGDFKLKVKRNSESASVSQPVQYHMPPQVSNPAPQPTAAPAPATATSPAKESEPETADGEIVKSPIVGTFYVAASPDSDPFVSVGDRVEKGQTLCIVEAMKIINEIEAEFAGTIQKVLVSDAQPVEFDQPLFIIKKG